MLRKLLKVDGRFGDPTAEGRLDLRATGANVGAAEAHGSSLKATETSDIHSKIVEQR